MKRLHPIEYDKDGNPIINLSADAANSDWIRAARLLREGKTAELEELEATPVFVEIATMKRG